VREIEGLRSGEEGRQQGDDQRSHGAKIGPSRSGTYRWARPERLEAPALHT
jgi:hypothetical protein